MKYVVSTLWTNELLVYDERVGEIVQRRDVKTANEFDRLHSVRYTPEGWLMASTYGVHLIDPDLQGPQRSWSTSRLSNVHACEWLGDNRIVIVNTGLDELLFCRLGEYLEIESLFDISAWMGLEKKIEVRDRRDEPRVKAENDHTHVNGAAPATLFGHSVLLCSLFHQNLVLVIDATSLTVMRVYRDLGLRIHSAIADSDFLWVCSSAESALARYDLETGNLQWRWAAQDGGWTRSIFPLGDGTAIFTSEHPREDPNLVSYIERIDLDRGLSVWRHDLAAMGPFDIRPFPHVTGRLG